jgi:hypothetical protein
LPASPARKLLVDFYCWAGGSKWAEDRDFAGRAWAEFVNNLIRELMASKGTVKKRISMGKGPGIIIHWVQEKNSVDLVEEIEEVVVSINSDDVHVVP